jgi:hypothetical protein
MKLMFLIPVIIITILAVNLYPQHKKNDGLSSVMVLDKSKYQLVTLGTDHSVSSEENSNPNSINDWVNITTENFEGTIPSTGWQIYAGVGASDTYWGKIQLTDNTYAGWCAAAGSNPGDATGYKDAMNAWMVYGPFDLSDATDAAVDFNYISSCEPSYDIFGWYASLDGTNYNGYFLSDSTSDYSWKSNTFDLKTVPTLGNLIGHSGVYIAFIFQSDSSISSYAGAYLDNIVLKKFTSGGVTYPSTIAINKSFTFSNITSSSSYRMIGLPGNINSLASQFITGTRGTDWNAFYDNGAASNYLIEFDGSATFNFKPGNGFWLLSKNAISVSTNVNTVALAGDNTYSIALHTGWNIISNPFERSTNWSAVIAANGLAANAVINSWNGSWTQPTSFIPYSAFYFNNTTGLTSLKIPYDPSGTLGKIIEENQIVFSESDLKISLNANGEEKSKVIIRINTDAINDYDVYDYFAPPGDFEEARIIIVNDKASSDYKYFMIDSRPEIDDGQIYDLKLKNVSNENVTLKIEGLNNYPGYEYYLIDNSLNNLIKLNEGFELNIASGIKEKDYSLVIGTESFIEKLKDDFTPKQFALMQNYPNPFNPSTKIKYTIPSSPLSFVEGLGVRLLVYDILGNEVATLVNEQQSPGTYEVEFDARTTNHKQLTSGVYFYTLRAGSFKETKKMILLR